VAMVAITAASALTEVNLTRFSLFDLCRLIRFPLVVWKLNELSDKRLDALLQTFLSINIGAALRSEPGVGVRPRLRNGQCAEDVALHYGQARADQGLTLLQFVDPGAQAVV